MAGGVKGTAIESVVADVRKLVETGKVSRQQLEVRLEAEDLALLEEKLLPSAWYALGSYGRMTQLLYDTEGRGRLTYLHERGRKAAERIRSAGLYAQLTANKDRWGDSLGNMMVTLGPAIYRDTEWRYRLLSVGGSGLRFHIEVAVPESFPDVCRHQTQGFIEHAASHAAGQHVRMSSARVSPTRMTFEGSTA
jgi:hypothetical protein